MADNNNSYKAKVELAFDNKGSSGSKAKRTEIMPERIKYVMIDYQYENVQIVPIVYIAMKVPVDLHDQIVRNYKTARFYFKLTRKDTASGSSVSSLAIKDTFSYVCTDEQQNYAKNLNDNGKDDKSYLDLTIGLVSETMTSSLRKPFNDIYNNIEVKELINKALEGLPKPIMTPLQYNGTIESFIVPPTTTRFRMLELIFDKLAFYDTNFNFFMDFNNKVYLLDKSGKTTASDGMPGNVYFNITQVDNTKAISPGGNIKNGSYQIFVNPTQTKFNVNEIVGQVANKIEAYEYSGKTQQLTIEKNTYGKTNKTMFMKTDNAAAYRNEAVNNTVLLELFKENIDSTIITPNRTYIVNQQNANTKYNGKYILSYKKEMYSRTGTENEFSLSCTVGLKKINSIEKANSTVDNRGGRPIAVNTSADVFENLNTRAATADDRRI